MNLLTSLWKRSAIVVAIALALGGSGGCGGSGSSGFDALPASEPEVIARAVERNECLTFDDTTFCGSEVEATSDDDDPVKVGIEEPDEPLLCQLRVGQPGCRTSAVFTPRQFAPGTTFLAATASSEEGPWTMVETAPTRSVDRPPLSRDALVILSQIGTRPDPVSLVVAVLVYDDRPAPDGLPAQADRLAAFTADFVFVSERLEVVVGD